MQTIGSTPLWIGFSVFVVVMLVLDLGVFNRKAHKISMKEAGAWTAAWVSLAVIFGIWIYFKFGSEPALQFFTGYLVEEALSVDNLFVFLVLFAYFKVPDHLQHRVLFWGIFGAVVLRAVFIFAGTALIQRFHWIIYIFGALLVFTGFKLFKSSDEEVEPEKNLAFRLLKKILPIHPKIEGSAFIITKDGKKHATMLLVVLVVVEATDVVFAIDSIPAIFGITTDPFIVYTSNIFAVLGLRSLFFLLAGMMGKFHYLKYALALVLIFVGGKMLASYWDVHLPVWVSLTVIAGILALGVIASIVFPAKVEPPPVHVEPPAKPPVG